MYEIPHDSRTWSIIAGMIEIIILAIIQGITEFLPVSSSGHLVVFEHFLGIEERISYTVLMHFGTLLAVLFFFRKKIVNLVKGVLKGEVTEIKYFIFIIVASIPAGIVGIFLKEDIKKVFENIHFIPFFFLFTGVVLFITKFFRNSKKNVDIFSAIVMGIGQAFAIIPGVSRSGIIISAGIFSKVKREEAFDFSFLLSIPAILGATLLEIKDIESIGICKAITAVVISFIAGVFALFLLKKAVITKRLWLFSFYCFGVSFMLFFIIF